MNDEYVKSICFGRDSTSDRNRVDASATLLTEFLESLKLSRGRRTRIVLRNLSFPDDRLLCDMFLNDGISTDSFEMKGCLINGPCNLSVNAVQSWNIRQIKLHIKPDEREAEWYLGLLPKLSACTNLQTLDVVAQGGGDKDAIVEKLGNILVSGNLKRMVLKFNRGIASFVPNINWTPLIEPLKQNISLEELSLDVENHHPLSKADKKAIKSLYHILKHYNTTLKSGFWFRAWEYSRRVFYKIQHLTDMNRYGRGIARDPKAPLKELVDGISTVGEMPETEGSYSDRQIHSVQYGLLLESVSKWSSVAQVPSESAPSRK